MLGGALAELLGQRPVSVAHWGLERIEALLDELDRPEEAFDAFHIAGTNGKGSTAVFAASLLRASGARTALYTSPHLADVRERFVVNGAWVEEDLLQAAADRLLACSTVSDATYFEAVTALAFLCFAESGVEVAVIETGLGGRLDATNALTSIGTAITTIGLEHTDLLGSTLEEIAGEKAGILRSGVPVSLGRMPPEARRIIADRAVEVGAPLAILGTDADVSDVDVGVAGTTFCYTSRVGAASTVFETALPGRYQADNAALALLMLGRSSHTLTEEETREGIRRAGLPGRFEIWRDGARTWVFDIAHNPVGIEVLLETWKLVVLPRPWVTVAAVLADKAWEPMLDLLALDSDAIILTQPASAPDARRWNLARARERVSRFSDAEIRVCRNMDEAIRAARELCASGTVLVTGSAYTVGDARGVLGVA